MSSNSLTQPEKVTLVNELIESDLKDQLSTGKYIVSIIVSVAFIPLIVSGFFRYFPTLKYKFSIPAFLFFLILILNVSFSSLRIKDKFQENAANYTSLIFVILALMVIYADMLNRDQTSLHSSMNYVSALILSLTNAMLLILAIVK